jgi:hypothetical protein
MNILGDWDLSIKTPIGSLAVGYTFTQGPRGVIGTATYKDETVALRDISVDNGADGDRVTWRQAVTKPMRLNLDFDVVVTGDRLVGHSRAGRLPRSTVIGGRRPEAPSG